MKTLHVVNNLQFRSRW